MRIALLAALAAVVAALWLVNTHVPIGRGAKTIMNALVVIFLVLWLLIAFGILGGTDFRVPERDRRGSVALPPKMLGRTLEVVGNGR